MDIKEYCMQRLIDLRIRCDENLKICLGLSLPGDTEDNEKHYYLHKVFSDWNKRLRDIQERINK